MIRRSRSRRAFTLIELLVVVAIIGLIIAVSFVAVMAQMPKIRLTNRAAEATAFLNRARQMAANKKKPAIVTVENEEEDGEVIRQYLVNTIDGVEKERLLIGNRASSVMLRAPNEAVDGPGSNTFPSDTIVFLSNGRLNAVGELRFGDFRDTGPVGRHNIMQIRYPSLTGLPKVEKFLYESDRPPALTTQEFFPERIGGGDAPNIWRWY